MSEDIQKGKYVKAVKFLTELGHIDSLINQIEEDYQNTCFKAQPKGITYDKVGTSGNGFHSQTEEVAVELEQLQRQKKKLIKRYANHKAEIYKVFNKMHTIEYVKVLLMFYSDRLSGDEVADKMNYSRTWVYVVRKRAIEEFTECMEDQYV